MHVPASLQSLHVASRSTFRDRVPFRAAVAHNVKDEAFVKKDLCSELLSADEFLVAFREQHADEIWDLTVQNNYQIFKEARQQLEKMLSGMTDALIIALEILSDLDRTQIALLSSTTVLAGHGFSALADWPKSEDWKDEEKTAFCHKFTRFVPGIWYVGGILDRWEELFKVLIDDIHMWSSEACCTDVLEGGRDDFDNYDYKKALEVLDRQNKHRIFEAKKMAKKERPAIVIRWELVDLKTEFNVC